MSNLAMDKLEENLFEEAKEKIEKNCFSGLDIDGAPYYSKTSDQIDKEAEKEVKELIERNS
jgi:hypothetical protein|tara:strand:- start:916 stop:1098 length:183 start_codon:yes stop_codon:yes gene_type:complete